MLLNILTFPSESLRKRARPVTELTKEIKTLISDMTDTLYESKGYGLAAPQVGQSLRLFVYDVTAGKEVREPKVIINPEILEADGEIVADEGCLSVPGEYAPVKRFLKVRAAGLDGDFKPVELICEGQAARIFQHEIDHLNGTLFLDRLPAYRRDTLKKHIKRRISEGDYAVVKG